MTTIEKIGDKLVLKYAADYAPSHWLEQNLKSDKDFKFKTVFNLNKNLLIKREIDRMENPEFYFSIGTLEDGYYKVDRNVFGLKNDFFFEEGIDLPINYFIIPSQISVLKKIDNNINQSVYIGGKKEDILPLEDFNKLLQNFPNSYEVNLYRDAKITSILGNYFSRVPDKEKKYNKYLNKKSNVKRNALRKSFKDVDIVKYEALLEKLKGMLENEIRYSENQWQEEILQIILLLFPKYIAVFTEVKFKDVYNNKNRRLDYGLIDFNGNLDLIEIKIPFEKSIVSNIKYRDNHIPNRDLSGAIMQIEKYIYYLNKLGKQGEYILTEKYKEVLPEGMEIKIVNPNGIIIMGRDIYMEPAQLEDFEIIKRKYKNLVDIFTYDDLLRRLEVTIRQLNKI